ncbi:RagB/SusD family nutrient uptake outer membrane protein [Bacteroides congonensis]|uniref:RagB/SusD family nutrient uptake outer membrane protein n=1 Tax=Bacteroides congonensis TaxID=1871006 RepID=UPI00189F2E18|nr:RagB/SusD family nutrient uptake outer membrane protein [Bacteroides congonensis]
MKFKKYLMAAFIAALSLNSCSFLEEDPSHIGTVETTYTTAGGLELALNACYSSLRDIHEDKTLWLDGTDLFGRSGIPESANWTATDFNVYSTQTHTSDNKVFYNFWTRCYQGINRTNIVLDQCKDIEMDEDLKQTRLAEATVLRALYYYYLVEQFGDIPLMLKHTEDINTAAIRDPEEKIYGQIISDVENVLYALDWQVDKFGRVSKGMAYSLLSKLYLTRGYKSYAESTDFSKAAEYARIVIDEGPYSLLTDYSDLFVPENEENSEIIFSVQYSSDLTTNGKGNTTHTLFGSYDGWTGMDRSTRYNRRLNKFSESFFLIYLFGVDQSTGKPLTAEITNGTSDGIAIVNLPPQSSFKIDKRFDGTFLRMLLADKDAKNYSPQVGANPQKANVKKTIIKNDTAIYMPYPNESWSFERIDKAGYTVLNNNMYHRRTSNDWAGDANNARPLLNKFWEPGMYDDAKGIRDLFLLRLGEVYLLAAEAYYKNDEPDKAVSYINQLRKRAYGKDWKDEYKLSENEVDIDLILDERGRELAGEAHCWVDLKRTGKLIERVKKYNLQAGHVNTCNISEKHYLRPLPFEWTSRLSNKVDQNPGYGQ